MTLLAFRAFWGMTGTIAEKLDQIVEDGYDGAEVWIDDSAPSPSELLLMLAERSLKLIVATRVFETEQLERTIQRLAAYQPMKINLQSGRDAMTFDEGQAFFKQALSVSQGVPMPVLHETHRGCLFFTPWVTAQYLRAFPDLRITADYSHWVNVCERLPEDQSEALTLANQHAQHIHGRVGYEEGPQVPDPAAPEYANQLHWHERHWVEIATQTETMTFTPEYGPPPYLHTLPYTNVPVADLRRVCRWGADRARAMLAAEFPPEILPKFTT